MSDNNSLIWAAMAGNRQDAINDLQQENQRLAGKAADLVKENRTIMIRHAWNFAQLQAMSLLYQIKSFTNDGPLGHYTDLVDGERRQKWNHDALKMAMEGLGYSSQEQKELFADRGFDLDAGDARDDERRAVLTALQEGRMTGVEAEGVLEEIDSRCPWSDAGERKRAAAQREENQRQAEEATARAARERHDQKVMVWTLVILFGVIALFMAFAANAGDSDDRWAELGAKSTEQAAANAGYNTEKEAAEKAAIELKAVEQGVDPYFDRLNQMAQHGEGENEAMTKLTEEAKGLAKGGIRMIRKAVEMNRSAGEE